MYRYENRKVKNNAQFREMRCSQHNICGLVYGNNNDGKFHLVRRPIFRRCSGGC